MSDLAFMQLVPEVLAEAGASEDCRERLSRSEWYILAHRQHLGGASERVVRNLLLRAIKDVTGNG